MSLDRASLAETADVAKGPLFPEGEPIVVRLSLAADDRIDPHTHPGRRIVFHVLSGQIELDLDEATHELAAGDVVRFDGERDVSPVAIEDSEALLVLARAGPEQE